MQDLSRKYTKRYTCIRQQLVQLPCLLCFQKHFQEGFQVEATINSIHMHPASRKDRSK